MAGRWEDSCIRDYAMCLVVGDRWLTRAWIHAHLDPERGQADWSELARASAGLVVDALRRKFGPDALLGAAPVYGDGVPAALRDAGVMVCAACRGDDVTVDGILAAAERDGLSGQIAGYVGRMARDLLLEVGVSDG